MLNEKHNDPFSWKNKLEGLAGLPGEAALDKNAAWEKLHGRFRQKPHRSSAVWYWAAACILLACIIPLMIANKKENIVVKNKPQQQNKITPPLQLQVPVRETATAPVKVEKKQVENSTTKDQHITNLKTTIKQDEPVIAIAETPMEKDAVATIIPAAGTDTAVTVAAAIPVKKKLSVVHINELDSPPAQFSPPNYVQNSFKVKFNNGKPTNKTIASQQYTGGFKIKLSSKN